MILVSDTSVLIDLERFRLSGDDLRPALRICRARCSLPPRAEGEWGERLVGLGLPLRNIERRRQAGPSLPLGTTGLSLADSFALGACQGAGVASTDRRPPVAELADSETSNATAYCGFWTLWKKREFQASDFYTMDWKSSLAIRAADCHAGK